MSIDPIPSADALRRRARHCLKAAHWDPFERHVLTLVHRHAESVRDMHARIVEADKADDDGRQLTLDLIDSALGTFLDGLTAEHVATARPASLTFGAATLSNRMHGLVERALEMVDHLRMSIDPKSAYDLETYKGTQALGLDRGSWRLRLDARTASHVWTIPQELRAQMERLSRDDDPQGRQLRDESRRRRLLRHAANSQPTREAIEEVVAHDNREWMLDRRLALTSCQMEADEAKGRTRLDLTLTLSDVAEWRLSTDISDHAMLLDGINMDIANTAYESAALLGRRIDRERRGLAEDDDALLALPLVSAMRMREAGGRDPGDYPGNEVVHASAPVELSPEVQLKPFVLGLYTMKVAMPLPEVVLTGAVGKPVTAIITHRWLTERMVIEDATSDGETTEITITMPIVRLAPVDDEDGDPVEAWRALHTGMAKARRGCGRDRRHGRRAPPGRGTHGPAVGDVRAVLPIPRSPYEEAARARIRRTRILAGSCMALALTLAALVLTI